MSDLISRQNAIDVFEILADKMSDAGKTVMAQAVAAGVIAFLIFW